jgi:hypothetical protein
MAIVYPEICKVLHGGPIVHKTHPEAAAQSFKAGAPVFLVAGKVTVIGTLGTDKIYGLAMQDATGVTDTPISVALLTTQMVLSICRNSGSTVIADIGIEGTLTFSGTAGLGKLIWTPAAAGVMGYCIDVDSRDGLGVTNGRLEVVLFPSQLALTILTT